MEDNWNTIKTLFFCLLFLIALSSSVLANHPKAGILNFQLTGEKAEIRETQAAYYHISTNQEVLIQFAVSELKYIGPHSESATLENTIYWLNNNQKMSFKSGRPLILNRPQGIHSFSIHGQIKVDSAEAQPAGSYQSTIYITVLAN